MFLNEFLLSVAGWTLGVLSAQIFFFSFAKTDFLENGSKSDRGIAGIVYVPLKATDAEKKPEEIQNYEADSLICLSDSADWL